MTSPSIQALRAKFVEEIRERGCPVSFILDALALALRDCRADFDNPDDVETLIQELFEAACFADSADI